MLGITQRDDGSLDDLFAGYLRHYEASRKNFEDVDAALVALAATTLKTAVLTNGTVLQQNA